MGNKVHSKTNPRQASRIHRKTRIKKKIDLQKGSVVRLTVYRSNRFLYAQIIDDLKCCTLAQANTQEEQFKSLSSKKNVEAAKALGKLIGQRAVDAKVDRILFDRNGF